MNLEQKMLINELTEDIINRFNIEIPIKDINQVVEKLGGKVEMDVSLFDKDGSVKKLDKGFIIFVSPHQSKQRMNFTIAHELGHLFLHMGYKTNSDRWEQQDDTTYYRSGDSQSEYQANEFAAAFLMPRKSYKKIMDENTNSNDIVNTLEIAKYFDVSVSAASNRGKFLGYLKW